MFLVKWSGAAIVRKSRCLKQQHLLTPIDNDILPSLRSTYRTKDISRDPGCLLVTGNCLLDVGCVAVDSLCAQLQKLAFVFNLLAPLCVRVMATGDQRQATDDILPGTTQQISPTNLHYHTERKNCRTDCILPIV